MKNINYKKNKKTFESIFKNRKNYKIWPYQNPKTKISPTERTYFNKRIKILIKLKYRIRSFLVKRGSFLVKKDLNISLGTNMVKNRPLCIFLPKRSAHRGDFDKTKYISFLIKNDELLQKYNWIWEIIKNSLKKEFYSPPVYNEKYLKAKINSYNWKINTNTHNNKNTKRRFSIYFFISNFNRPCF